MKNNTSAVVALFIAVVLGAGYYYWYLPQSLGPSTKITKSETSENKKESSAADSDANVNHYPVESDSSKGDATKPESKLIKNDSTLESVLGQIFGESTLASLFNMQGFPQRLVLTVESAENLSLAPRDRWPLQSPELDFVVMKNGDKEFIAPENEKRYAPYVELVRHADVQDAVDAYSHFYSIFQSAYLELGAGKYFNDRLVQLIDDLLAAPDVKGPIEVVRAGEHGKYLYADDQLENLSPAKKFMIRMGHENAAAVKSKLKLVRSRLVGLGKKKH